jgi:hypothetical protein
MIAFFRPVILFTFGLAIFRGALDQPVFAQPQEFNYDESKVPDFSLPDPLVDASGKPVATADAWTKHRRQEVLQLFEDQVYGRPPTAKVSVEAELFEEDAKALGGAATRRQVRLELKRGDKSATVEILMYLPNKARDGKRDSGKGVGSPVFVGLNFQGNHAIANDPKIAIPTSWVRKGKDTPDNRATEAGRGSVSSRWPLETIIARGYAVATVYYGDIDPDFDDGFKNGVHGLFRDESQEWTGDAWGSIAGWAWGLSRVVDFLETQDEVDSDRIILMGHSRLGKTALWAGAREQRFALVISNDSGCGGAALSRRRFGETVKRINTSFPHWFCDNFQAYNDKENELPIDQHMLIALVAPRPVLVCSAVEDTWADPHGEFLAARHADPVYRLLGTDGIARKEMPGINDPIMSTIGYHIRPGGHDVTMRDWEIYMGFADKHLPSK